MFISYKRDIDVSHIEGSSIAANLYVELEKAGFHTFFDKEEMGLNSYKENIEAAILSSDVFILVVSPNVFSENVEFNEKGRYNPRRRQSSKEDRRMCYDDQNQRTGSDHRRCHSGLP